MPMGLKPVLYIANVLPGKSETFVYREIFALRSLGITVLTASVHEPDRDLGSSVLDALSDSAIKIYSSGVSRLLRDAMAEFACRPLRTISTYALACADAIRASDVKGLRRVKILAQAIAAIGLARRVRSLGVAHIHAHMAHVPTTIAMYAARQLGVPFSFTGHANDLFPSRSLLKEKLRRSAFTACISNWHRDFYESIYKKNDCDYPIVRCGVDTRTVAPIPRRTSRQVKVLGVGRLVSKKGFDILIRAAGMIAERRSADLEVSIVGSGPEEAGLRGLIAALPSSARVVLLGEKRNEEVMSLMGECDIFVLPMRIASTGDRDGIPVVLMEAMAKGRCVVSGDMSTIRELVDDGRSGYLFPMEDERTLAGILERLAASPELMESSGKEARRKIEAEFDTTTNARILLAAMNRCGLGALV